ncbi:MAG: hypothetical protein ACI3ZO_06020 [Candidatus Cryptobacteroides sp.]
MMGKNYQLVAWTDNISDSENGRLGMIPSLHYEMQEPYIREIGRCQAEERKAGTVSTVLARRYVRAYEENAEFMFLTGFSGDGIRSLFKAASYCIDDEDLNWAYIDTDLGSYTYYCGPLSHEFDRLCRKCIRMMEKYSRTDILLEDEPKYVMGIYNEHLRESRDLAAYVEKD